MEPVIEEESTCSSSSCSSRNILIGTQSNKGNGKGIKSTGIMMSNTVDSCGGGGSSSTSNMRAAVKMKYGVESTEQPPNMIKTINLFEMSKVICSI